MVCVRGVRGVCVCVCVFVCVVHARGACMRGVYLCVCVCVCVRACVRGVHVCVCVCGVRACVGVVCGCARAFLLLSVCSV